MTPWKGWEQTLQLLKGFAETELGKGKLQNWLPPTSLEGVVQVQRLLQEQATLEGRSVQGWLEMLGEALRWIEEKHPLNLPKEEALGNFVAILQELYHFYQEIRESNCSLLKAEIEPLPTFKSLLEHWLPKFTPEGHFKPNASPELEESLKAHKRIHKKLQRALSQCLTRYGEYLQESQIHFMDHRFALPIKMGLHKKVSGFVVKISSSKATIFIEPFEVVALSNELKLAEERVREAIQALILEFLKELQGYYSGLEGWETFLAFWDARQALLTFKDKVSGIFPECVEPDQDFQIYQARHPLLDERLHQERVELLKEAPEKHQPCIPLTLSWAKEKSILVISGPNGGGKTVALETVALCWMMALRGWPIPAAPGTQIPFIHQLEILFGDTQNILEGLSTFTAGMGVLKTWLDQANGLSAFFVDEIGFGTDPEEGAVLGYTLLEALAEKGARVMVTTHLNRIKMLATTHPKFLNAHMGYDDGANQPTFRIHMGIPGSSFALSMARSLAFPENLLKRAEALLGERHQQEQHFLNELASQVHLYQTKIRELQEMKQALKAEQLALEKAYEEKMHDLNERFAQAKETLRKEVMKQLDRLQAGKKARQKTLETLHGVPKPFSHHPLVDKAIQPRQWVRLPNRMKGFVEKVEPHGVTLLVEGKKMMVAPEAISEIIPPPKGIVQHNTQDSPLETPEVQVIGLDVESAWETIEPLLEQIHKEGGKSLLVIHGHGTGRLREGLRRYLTRNKWVKRVISRQNNGATEVVLQ